MRDSSDDILEVRLVANFQKQVTETKNQLKKLNYFFLEKIKYLMVNKCYFRHNL